MNVYDLHITIKPREKGLKYFPIICQSKLAKTKSGMLFIPRSIIIGKNNISSGKMIGKYVYDAFLDSGIWNIIELILQKHLYTPPFNALLLEINATELQPLLWENIFDSLAFSRLKTYFKVVRFSPGKLENKWPALKLPIQIGMHYPFENKNIKRNSIDPTYETLRYFNVKMAGITAAVSVAATMRQDPYDIVHLVGSVSQNIKEELVFMPANLGFEKMKGEELTFRYMVSLLQRCGARLAIFQCRAEELGNLLAYTHQVARVRGPVILVITYSSKNKRPYWSLDQLYINIVHDFDLDLVYALIPKKYNPTLFISDNKRSLLRISTLADNLLAKYNKQSYYATQILRAANKRLTMEDRTNPNEPLHSINTPFVELGRFIDQSNPDVNRSFNYDRESGGMEPLKKITGINKLLSDLISKAEMNVKRVVNCWFRFNDKNLNQKDILRTNQAYYFDLNIGLAMPSSILVNPTGFPEKALAPFYQGEYLKLKVVLFSTDFAIAVPTLDFVLPHPPLSTETISFAIRTPVKPKIARMRVCIYYNQNLIQSLSIQAIVGKSKSLQKLKISKINTAILDYSLSNNFDALKRFPERTLNIATNESGTGTHSLFISGESLQKQLDFGEGAISSFINASRDALQYICGGNLDNNKPTPYRFDSANRGNEKDFIDGMKMLAELGYKLYVELMTSSGDRPFQQALEKILLKPGAIIQIASTKTSKYILPWALVYDKKWVSDGNLICPQFLSDIKSGNTQMALTQQTCILNGCVHQSNNRVICPSGFWGFKHIIEQPLSVNSLSTSTATLPLEIKSPPVSSIIMCVSQKLNNLSNHIQDIKNFANTSVSVLDSKATIESGIKRNDLQIIYFYCHGGRTGPKVWLGVGSKESIEPAELFSWDPQWQPDFPFVFVNGCHTISATPDDFLAFNTQFARLQAAGLMGTEISITEGLASYFAKEFLAKFLTGVSVGIALREQRLTMLKNFNPLGLAFTPFCSANLSLIHSSP